jgi:DNA-binding NtrC family response regulator
MTDSTEIVIVVIDDNEGILELVATALSREGVRIITASDPEEGIEAVFREHPQIVLTDLIMPSMSGLEVLDRIVEFDPSIDVILMTAHYTSESAVDAIRRGAADYLNKPVPIAALRERIEKLTEDARRRRKAVELESELGENARFEGMVGRGPAVAEMFSRIRRIAPHFRTVMVTGETGTGKELAARAIHNLSPVRNGRFVVINCSAVVESLFESELFGHARGAFTGATQDKMGLFEFADKGVIFLDEIGDMPLGTQAKLLRALQNQEVLRVGSLTPRKVDVRAIAATHRDLRAAVAARQFREDLFYRLSMVEIHVPSLAERKEDLPLLISHFVEKFSKQYNKQIRGLTQRSRIVLARHDWPGNIRELENVLGYACMMVFGDMIDIHDLPEYLRVPGRRATITAAIPEPVAEASLEEHEKRLLADAMAGASGNQSEAARALRIGRDALRYKLKKHGLL